MAADVALASHPCPTVIWNGYTTSTVSDTTSSIQASTFKQDGFNFCKGKEQAAGS